VGNPSGTYKFGSKLKTVIETARQQVAGLVNAQPREVIFTFCGTESNNAAIHAALQANPHKRHVITSVVEHLSVLNYCMALERGLLADSTKLKADDRVKIFSLPAGGDLK
jgi:cysteine desulfurase